MKVSTQVPAIRKPLVQKVKREQKLVVRAMQGGGNRHLTGPLHSKLSKSRKITKDTMLSCKLRDSYLCLLGHDFIFD